tara:strand:- start:24 stop:665 length:642 start_codon:yes stop_codon:yes gene_type:complete
MAYIGKRPTDTFRSIAAKDTFTGDGSTTTFDITNAAASANDLMVFVDNVRQEPGAGKSYTLAADGSGLLKRVTFDAAPDASAEIYVINPHLAPEAVASAQNLEGRAFTNQTELNAVAADDDVLLIYDTSASTVKKIQKSNIATTLSYVTRNYTGDNSDTTFTVTSGTAVDNVLVFENGVLQKPTTDYTISGTTLTFTTAPATGVAIQIRELPR